MSRETKVLFGLSLLFLILSYPACHFGEIKAKSEMAKYSAEFVAAHEFDMIFVRWVLPGISMFFLAGGLAFAGVVVWLVDRSNRKRATR